MFNELEIWIGAIAQHTIVYNQWTGAAFEYSYQVGNEYTSRSN